MCDHLHTHCEEFMRYLRQDFCHHEFGSWSCVGALKVSVSFNQSAFRRDKHCLKPTPPHTPVRHQNSESWVTQFFPKLTEKHSHFLQQLVRSVEVREQASLSVFLFSTQLLPSQVYSHHVLVINTFVGHLELLTSSPFPNFIKACRMWGSNIMQYEIII